MNARLFYSNQLVQEFDSPRFPRLGQYLHTNWGLEIYNGGYVYALNWGEYNMSWYRCDGTPVLPEHVPKELLMLNLLLS